eukprot:6084-Rhodomonas_salina.1
MLQYYALLPAPRRWYQTSMLQYYALPPAPRRWYPSRPIAQYMSYAHPDLPGHAQTCERQHNPPLADVRTAQPTPENTAGKDSMQEDCKRTGGPGLVRRR